MLEQLQVLSTQRQHVERLQSEGESHFTCASERGTKLRWSLERTCNIPHFESMTNKQEQWMYPGKRQSTTAVKENRILRRTEAACLLARGDSAGSGTKLAASSPAAHTESRAEKHVRSSFIIWPFALTRFVKTGRSFIAPIPEIFLPYFQSCSSFGNSEAAMLMTGVRYLSFDEAVEEVEAELPVFRRLRLAEQILRILPQHIRQLLQHRENSVWQRPTQTYSFAQKSGQKFSSVRVFVLSTEQLQDR